MRKKTVVFLVIVLLALSLSVGLAISKQGEDDKNDNWKKGYKKVAKWVNKTKFDKCEKYHEHNECSDIPNNESCNKVKYFYEVICNPHIEEEEVYEDVDVNLTIRNVIWVYEDFGKCNKNNNHVICETFWDSNMNGEPNGGESYIKYDLEGKLIESKLDNSYYKGKVKVIKQ